MLIGKSSPCGGSRFPFSLSEWSFTICLTTYNRKQNVLSASLNKTFPSFLPSITTQETIAKMYDIIMADRRVTDYYIATELGIFQDISHPQRTSYICTRCQHAVSQPHLLGPDLKRTRLKMSREIFSFLGRSQQFSSEICDHG